MCILSRITGWNTTTREKTEKMERGERRENGEKRENNIMSAQSARKNGQKPNKKANIGQFLKKYAIYRYNV
jgi:hypothetical protein